jgi:hypothetical protein
MLVKFALETLGDKVDLARDLWLTSRQQHSFHQALSVSVNLETYDSLTRHVRSKIFSMNQKRKEAGLLLSFLSFISPYYALRLSLFGSDVLTRLFPDLAPSLGLEPCETIH